MRLILNTVYNTRMKQNNGEPCSNVSSMWKLCPRVMASERNEQASERERERKNLRIFFPLQIYFQINVNATETKSRKAVLRWVCGCMKEKPQKRNEPKTYAHPKKNWGAGRGERRETKSPCLNRKPWRSCVCNHLRELSNGILNNKPFAIHFTCTASTMKLK